MEKETYLEEFSFVLFSCHEKSISLNQNTNLAKIET